MTATAIVWVAAISLWAGVIALVGIATVRRLFAWYHSHGRHPAPQEPPSPATAATAGTVHLPVVRDVVDGRGPVPRRPEPHEGATKEFGAELHALRDAPVAPELVTDVETELRWARIWHDFEQDLQTQVGEIFNPRLSAFTAPLDADTCMRLAAAAWETGEFDRAELDEMLAVAG